MPLTHVPLECVAEARETRKSSRRRLLGAAAASGALVAGGLTLPKAQPAGAQQLSAQQTETFTSKGPPSPQITIHDQTDATPYPSVINVSGMPGAISNTGAVRVTLHGLTHDRLQDIQMCLVSPQGKAVWLMGTVGGPDTSARNMRLDLYSTAPDPLPNADFDSGHYKPWNYDASQDTAFPSPGPTLVTSVDMNDFAGLAGDGLNGQWKLFIRDNNRLAAGTLDSWSIRISTNKDFVIRNDRYTVKAGETLSVKRPGIFANDTDDTGRLRLPKVIRRTNRLGRLTVKRNGALTFVARRNVSGRFNFRYRARSTSGFSGTARVTIRVKR